MHIIKLPKLFLFLCLFPILVYSKNEKICFFHPPKGWQCSHPIPPYIKIGFIGPSKKFFRPSINLATEKIDISASEYVKAVKGLHQTDPTILLRDLGNIATKAGKGQLLDLSSKTKVGAIKRLQLIVIQDNHAYILTGAVIKDEFNKTYKQLLRSFKSLTITDNLLSPIEDKNKKKLLTTRIKELENIDKKDLKGKLEKLQNFILNNFEDMGQYWQILMIKKIYEDYNSKI